MALIYANRVQETTTTTGTGTITLAGAVSGYQSFAAIGNGNTCIYCIEDAGGGWEVGVGTYTSSGTTLARTTILASSNGGSAITLSGGTHKVYVTLDASTAKLVQDAIRIPGYFRGSGDGTNTQSFTSSTWTRLKGSSESGCVRSEVADQNGWFDLTVARFTPQLAGRYFLMLRWMLAMTAGSGVLATCNIYKNGSAHVGGNYHATPSGSFNEYALLSSGVVEANGSTDYFEPYGYLNATSPSFTASASNFFLGWYLGPS